MPGTGALLLLAFASLVVVVLLILLQLTRLGFLSAPPFPTGRGSACSRPVSFFSLWASASCADDRLSRRPFSGDDTWNALHHLVWEF